LYFGHKIWMATHYVVKECSWNGRFQPGAMARGWLGQWSFAHPIEEIDVLSGKREMDELEAMDVPPVPKNALERFWFWLA